MAHDESGLTLQQYDIMDVHGFDLFLSVRRNVVRPFVPVIAKTACEKFVTLPERTRVPRHRDDSLEMLLV